MRFANRQEAGQKLAQALRRFRGNETVILALPCGGVVVGAAVAKVLGAPLGLVLVRKLGHPFSPEYAVGAIAEDGQAIYNPDEVVWMGEIWRKQAEDMARKLITRRRVMYYGTDHTPPDVESKIVIIVDDGIATGLTMEAAVRSVQSRQPKKVVVAAPIAAADSFNALQEIADEVVALDDPEKFLGTVSAHYREFNPVDDQEVIELLQGTKHES